MPVIERLQCCGTDKRRPSSAPQQQQQQQRGQFETSRYQHQSLGLINLTLAMFNSSLSRHNNNNPYSPYRMVEEYW